MRSRPHVLPRCGMVHAYHMSARGPPLPPFGIPRFSLTYAAVSPETFMALQKMPSRGCRCSVLGRLPKMPHAGFKHEMLYASSIDLKSM